jgi:hypothetical protein
MDLTQGPADILLRDTEMSADRNRAQGVIDTETPGRGNMCVEGNGSLCVKGDPQLSGSVDQLDVFRTQIVVLSKAEGLHSTGVAFQDPAAIWIISVENTRPALPEEKALTMQIIFKISMFIRTDMIG